MKSREIDEIFNETESASYDGYWVKLSAMREALHLLTRVVLNELPSNAHIVCVGAGTGEELLNLAQHNQKWRFTAVDPSAHMLEICKRKMQQHGIASRCIFHEGYVNTLSSSTTFDAATCFLVSHFLHKRDERQALFKEIGSHLVPGGLLVNADFIIDERTPQFNNMLSLWKRLMRYAELSEEEIEEMHNSFIAKNSEVSLISPNEIEAIIIAGGFKNPTLFYQSSIIHAWYSTLDA